MDNVRAPDANNGRPMPNRQDNRPEPPPGTTRRALAVLAALCLWLGLAAAVPAGPPATPAAPEPLADGLSLGLMDTIRLTLAQNLQINLAEQDVEVSKGNLEAAQGRFDLNLSSYLSQSYNTAALPQIDREAYQRNAQNTNVTSFNLGATQLLRNGLTLNPYLTVSRSRDTLAYPNLPASQAKVAFEVVVPLMRGLGEEATAAPERAARYTLDSSRLTYFHTASLNVYQAIYDYWQLRQAQLVLDVYLDSEQRAVKLLGEVGELAAADQAPKSTLTNLRANLNLKSAQRLAAEQTLLGAAENLANDLGLAQRAPQAGLRAAEDFPAQPAAPDPNATAGLHAMALERRADLQAARAAGMASRENLVAARDAMRPQVNLTLGAGYNGLSEIETYDSYYRSFEDGIYGPNALGRLDFAFPVENRAARGQMVASQAQLRQAQINERDTRRRVELGVASALANLGSAADQCAKAKDAVENYRKASVDERTKFTLGTSTILDVIQVEDQLTTALLNEVTARQAYASALVRLRYETGTLISGDPQSASLERMSLLTLPNQGAQP